ncbi:MAG: RluA family pseudouridine synthase [Candidatus Schekmanbacteria bacterium]|nr:MAG: RluA family pseudouridine synthase [Candidatus Schekmanbacteria bacterium]
MEKKIKIEVGVEDRGERIDSFLSRKLPELTRSSIQRLIKNGKITIQDTHLKAGQKLKGGEEIEIFIPPPSKPSISAEKIPLDIVYEDSDLIVINKPAGMVVHPAAGNYSGTLVNALLYHCKDLSGIGGEARPGIVHRLDKDTSGLLVAAKNDKSHLALSKQLKSRALTRKYLAITRGIPRQFSGKIDAPIGRSPKHRKKMAVLEEGGRQALTYYKVIEKFPNYALLELSLKTGRTHQIRVHLKSINCPVLGDKTYGHGITEKERRKGIILKRQALHAAFIKFIHPSSKKEIELSAPLPKDMEETLKIMRNG